MERNATDAAIVRTIIGDRDVGFTEMVRSHQAGIYSGVRRLVRRPEIAEEIAQDTFLRAYAALERWDRDRIADLRVRPWLWTIALNLCRDHGSKATTEAPLPDIEREGTTDPQPIDDDAWNRRLAALTDVQRTAVVLRHVLDLPVAEIAEIMERPEGTVKADISRGLARLRTTLEAEEARS